MARTARSIARSKERKAERALSSGWSGKGPSLLEKLESAMFDYTKEYLKLRKKEEDPFSREMRYKRGVIRGVAHSIVLFRTPYLDPAVDIGPAIEEVEKEWVEKVKAVKKAGKQKSRRAGAMQMHW